MKIEREDVKVDRWYMLVTYDKDGAKIGASRLVRILAQELVRVNFVYLYSDDIAPRFIEDTLLKSEPQRTRSFWFEEVGTFDAIIHEALYKRSL